MFRRTAISVAALGAFTVLAFGSMSGGSSTSGLGSLTGGGQGNVDACKAYVDHFNALDCVPDAANIDVETTCQGQESVPADTSPMWECMVANATCKDGAFDAGNQSDCAGKVSY